MKSFNEYFTEAAALDEANPNMPMVEKKRHKTAYDISDFPEDGLDDLMWMLGGVGKAKQGKDWDLIDTRKGLQLHTYSTKGSKAAEKFFGKRAPELIK